MMLPVQALLKHGFCSDVTFINLGPPWELGLWRDDCNLDSDKCLGFNILKQFYWISTILPLGFLIVIKDCQVLVILTIDLFQVIQEC